ncbi:MAG: ribonuclease HII [Bacteroidetes bacterium]|nr:ribonuclease HII [Bacteroidota bacterium]
MLKSAYSKFIEAGVDEAGRGCLAGPVYAAAVILPEKYQHELLNDSKKLSAAQRQMMRIEIEKNAVAWAVGSCTHKEIDTINILQASWLAMHRAIAQLKTVPELLLIDGNRFKTYPEIKHVCIVKGDATYLSIAAASILAKTHRDEYMEKLDQLYPQYNWKKNKAYATNSHVKAIMQHGYCEYHRKSFQLKAFQTKLTFGTD